MKRAPRPRGERLEPFARGEGWSHCQPSVQTAPTSRPCSVFDTSCNLGIRENPQTQKNSGMLEDQGGSWHLDILEYDAIPLFRWVRRGTPVHDATLQLRPPVRPHCDPQVATPPVTGRRRGTSPQVPSTAAPSPLCRLRWPQTASSTHQAARSQCRPWKAGYRSPPVAW